MPSPELIIRPAVPTDVDAVVALVQSAYRGESSRAGWTTEADLLAGQRTDPAEVTAKITAEAGEVLLGVSPEGAIVACCELQLLRPQVAYFGMFAVEPQLQAAGLGRRMLEAAEAEARERWSATAIEMTVIEQRGELIAWYERRGYRRTGEVRPFPYGDVTKGVPQRDDLGFVVLTKSLA